MRATRIALPALTAVLLVAAVAQPASALNAHGASFAGKYTATAGADNASSTCRDGGQAAATCAVVFKTPTTYKSACLKNRSGVPDAIATYTPSTSDPGHTLDFELYFQGGGALESLGLADNGLVYTMHIQIADLCGDTPQTAGLEGLGLAGTYQFSGYVDVV